MLDQKLTDNEIIELLDNCCNSTHCYGCQFEEERGCASHVAQIAFDLINRQRAEIEMLKGYVTPVVQLLNTYDIMIAKAEAYKEFADKVHIQSKSRKTGKSQYYYGRRICVLLRGQDFCMRGINDFVDAALKEMVGEKE